MVSAGRGPDGLVQLDAPLRHHRGAGCGDPVPRLGRGLLHHGRDLARGGGGSRLTEANRRASGPEGLRAVSLRCRGMAAATEGEVMSASLVNTRPVQELLTRVSGIQKAKEGPRLK